ncbi:MAG: membrane protein insertase YidC [Pseudomonadota bacterium]
MDIEKRMFLAIAVCILIWIAFSPKAVKKADKPGAKVVAEQSQVDNSAEGQERKSSGEQGNKEPSERGNKAEETGTQNLETRIIEEVSVKESLQTLENDLFKISVLNKEGLIKSIKLKNYKSQINKSSSSVEMVGFDSSQYYMPFWNIQLAGDDEVLKLTYDFEKSEKNEIILKSLPNPYFIVSKKYKVDENSYVIETSMDIENISESNINFSTIIKIPQNIPEDEKTSGFLSFATRPNMQVGMVDILGKVQRETLSSMKENESKNFDGSFIWAGLGDKYFANLVLPLKTELKSTVFSKESKDLALFKATHANKKLEPGEKTQIAFRLFSGPLEIDVLQNTEKELGKAIDLGNWLGPIARPMLKLMKFIHNYIPNYGIAIIILTILVKLLLFPLNQKQYKSMKAMQLLQPKIAELKEKFKDNKEKLNMETMNLFKQHKVNPMGGCLPMLFQFPIFIALYRVLYNSIELRHAPFMGWIKDLSAPDPLYISPVIMGITMFLQQQMTPTTTMDPAQAKMMKIIPLVFALFMIMLPSGLVIYIFINSLLSILQQWLITRKKDVKI